MSTVQAGGVSTMAGSPSVPVRGAAARWVAHAPGSETADHSLYCFAHGGGSPAEYIRWSRDMRRVGIRAIQLPGRGSRLGEPARTDLADLVEEIVAEVAFAPSFSFFGHSFGALLAYEVASALADAGRPLPRRLIVSGYPAAHLPRQHQNIHLLPDDQILRTVAARHGGIPEEVLHDPNLSRIAAACVRADFQIVETYAWRPRPPLPIPVTVLGGRDDSVSEEQLAAWGELTTAGKPAVRMFDGGHFYFRDRQRAVLRVVEALALTAPSQGTAAC